MRQLFTNLVGAGEAAASSNDLCWVSQIMLLAVVVVCEALVPSRVFLFP